jgi:hypothetical protein
MGTGLVLSVLGSPAARPGFRAKIVLNKAT